MGLGGSKGDRERHKRKRESPKGKRDWGTVAREKEKV